MTNIRSKGYDSSAQLREHMAEIEDMHPGPDLPSHHHSETTESEIVSLRCEVDELRKRLLRIREQTEDIAELKMVPPHSWLKIGAAMAATFVLGRLVQRLRLGAPGAAAVPMVVAQLDRRIWG